MITPTLGRPSLVLDELIILDGATGSQASTWVPPREKYIDFGDANQAMFSFEVYGGGPGIGSVTLYAQRTASSGSDDEDFENMNATGVTLAATHAWHELSFGRDPTTAGDKPPQGLGRPYLKNGHATNFAVVRLRVWVELQRYPQRRGGR